MVKRKCIAFLELKLNFAKFFFLQPRYTDYGPWPMSGEIDLAESRGNQQLYRDSINVGTEQISSTLHFGPKAGIDAWRTAHYTKNAEINSFNQDFHIYRLIWTPSGFEFYIDYELVGTIEAGKGFFQRGRFNATIYSDPWTNGTLM